jgi:hypothetical protein
MATVNLRSFRQIVRHNNKAHEELADEAGEKCSQRYTTLRGEADKVAWAKTDCLDCANCCKTMSPTYTKEDIRRISAHLGMTEKAFREKWLYKDKTGRLDECKATLPVPGPHDQQV